MPRSTRGIAVHRSYQQPAEITAEGGRLRRLSSAQDGLIDYAVRATGQKVCCGMLMLALAFPVAMAVMGCIYFYECPAENNIPIYLVVGGLSFIVYVVGRYYSAASTKGYYTFLSIFSACWFITGSVWIFSIYEPNYDKTTEKYCNKVLYLFAFWVTIAEYVMSVIMIFYLCILCHISLDLE